MYVSFLVYIPRIRPNYSYMFTVAERENDLKLLESPSEIQEERPFVLLD